jgi:uncharacterized membrane-anchored protein
VNQRRTAAEALTVGPARVDRRTKRLVQRLRPGEIAVIDHEDLDRIAAEALIEAGAAAVINASSCISGRYPNEGPLLLAAAGVPIVDGVGSSVIDAIPEGQVLRVEGNGVWMGEEKVATGTRHTLASLEAEYDAAKVGLGDELQAFAANTLEYLRRERHFMLAPLVVPELRTRFAGRQVLIVVRGADYREDLAALGAYVREMRPVLVGVDGGADAILESGLQPDVIVGDFDSVSTAALLSGAELIVQAYAGGEAPGEARLREMALPYVSVEASGTSEDLAMLLAYEAGAELIVAVGTHASMVDFLGKGRAGMASTFLARLKVGPILVDAKGVSRLYRSRVRKADLAFLVLAAMLCMGVMIAVASPLHVFFHGFRLLLHEAWRSVTH